MVNPKRIEQKFPLLISNGPSWSWEYEEKEYLVQKLKQKDPTVYALHRNKIVNEIEALEHAAMELKRKKHNGDSGRR